MTICVGQVHRQALPRRQHPARPLAVVSMTRQNRALADTPAKSMEIAVMTMTLCAATLTLFDAEHQLLP